MSEEEKLETLKDKFLKYHLEYKDEEMLFEIIDKLQEEVEYLRKREEHLDRRRDKLEQKNEELEENNLSYQKELAKAWKENEKLKEENKKQYKQFIKDHTEVIEALKKEQEDKIRTKIKELEKTKNYIISMYAIGVLEELLGDDE